MTDEEKAEEYVYSLDFFHDDRNMLDCIKQGYLDGLEEGRKESVFYKEHLVFYEKLCEERAKELNELEKENAELKAQIEKMKCCQMCKHLQNNGSCLKADNEEVKKWGDFLIETRRKNFCKNWELVK